MTAHDPVVRRARPDDAEAIADAHIRGWQTAYRGLVPDAVLDGFSAERRIAWWNEELARPDSSTEPTTTWVVEAPDGVAGFVYTGPARDGPVAPPAGAGEVFAIYLRPERRGQGYGRVLFAAATADLEQRGLTPLVVWVFEANPPARRFYEAAGFRADGARHAIDFDGVVVPEIRYVRPGP